jgi:hypothetical protein
MIKDRILDDKGNFLPFPEHLEKKAIESGVKSVANGPEKPEPLTNPENSAKIKKEHNRKALKQMEEQAKKEEYLKELE